MALINETKWDSEGWRDPRGTDMKNADQRAGNQVAASASFVCKYHACIDSAHLCEEQVISQSQVTLAQRGGCDGGSVEKARCVRGTLAYPSIVPQEGGFGVA